MSCAGGRGPKAATDLDVLLRALMTQVAQIWTVCLPILLFAKETLKMRHCQRLGMRCKGGEASEKV